MSDTDADATLPTVEGPASVPAPGAASAPAVVPVPARPLDLDGIERDLADVELALTRLDDGAYWTDEVTGDLLPDELLAEHPTARRLADR